MAVHSLDTSLAGAWNLCFQDRGLSMHRSTPMRNAQCACVSLGTKDCCITHAVLRPRDDEIPLHDTGRAKREKAARWLALLTEANTGVP